MYFRLCLSPIEKLRRGGCKIQFHRDVEFVSGCIIYYEKLHRGECKVQFHKDVECVSDCIDLLLNAPLGKAPNPECHKDMECIFSL